MLATESSVLHSFKHLKQTYLINNVRTQTKVTHLPIITIIVYCMIT